MFAFDHQAAARRWVKFPAWMLCIMGLVWLLQKYFQLDWPQISEVTETGIGALWVFTDMVVIPLGSLVLGVCVLFLQRWALWTACLFPLLPLCRATLDLLVRISHKFSEYHVSLDTAKFGGGVMTALEILAIWVLYGLVVYHLRKALYWQQQFRQWTGSSAVVRSGLSQPEPVEPSGGQVATGDVCLLMPDVNEDDGG